MKCIFGGSSHLKTEYLHERVAMLQSMLLQEQREKLALEAHLHHELHHERAKCAMLEQELAKLSAAAQEMGDTFVQYFSNAPQAADTRRAQDQQRNMIMPAQASFGSPFAPAAANLVQLQAIPEHLQKPEEMLALAEQLKHFAAGWQQRLASGSSAGNSPSAADCAAAAAAGPFADGAAAAAGEGKGPSRAHSISVPSEPNGSMDLPMQALAASRLALQLHQPLGAGDDTSCYSSSGRKSSCTVLNASMDLTSSISSFRSLRNGGQMHPAGPGGAQEHPGAADGAAAQLSQQVLAARRAAERGARARGAAAVAASCASIAGAAAATAAASAARTAAHAAAMADRSLRASTDSGFSALTSPGKSAALSGGLSSTLRHRQEWQAAQQQWQQQQQQHFTNSNPLWAPSPDQGDPGSSDGSDDSRPGSGEPFSEEEAAPRTAERLPGSMWGTPLQEFTPYNDDTPSPSQPASPPPPAAAAAAPPSPAQAAQDTVGALPRLPAVPGHLMAAQAQRPGLHQQEPRLLSAERPPVPQHPPAYRYCADKLSTLSPLTESSGSAPAASAAPGVHGPAAQQQQQLAGSCSSRPPMYLVDTPDKRGAKPSGLGPLHKHLASLSTSLGSLRAAAAGARHSADH